MHKVSRLNTDIALSGTSIISDNENVQEDPPVKKKCLWASFDKNSKRRKLTINQQMKAKMNRNCHCTQVLNTLTERRTL